MQPSALFLPGWGAPAALYEPGLPHAWRALEPPSFAASGGSLEAYRRWLGVELTNSGRSLLGGHARHARPLAGAGRRARGRLPRAHARRRPHVDAARARAARARAELVTSLYLVRHAIAENRDAERWPDDALRPLTKDGERK